MKQTTDDLVVTGALGTAWANWDAGVSAYIAGDYATARRIWLPLARAGDKKAQYNLGVIHANGKGVAQNYTEAVKWWIKAAQQGHPGAQFSLGSSYYLGKGFSKNYLKAYMWLYLAKQQGHKKAINGSEIVDTEMNSIDINMAKNMAKKMSEQLRNRSNKD